MSNQTNSFVVLPYTKAQARTLTEQWWNAYTFDSTVSLNQYLKLTADQFDCYLQGKFMYKDE